MVLALHSKMNFIKVFKMLLKRQYLYSSGWLILLHFFKKNLGRVPGVLFFAVILKKNWGVFRACSGRVAFASFCYKNSWACSGRVQCVPVCSVCCFY